MLHQVVAAQTFPISTAYNSNIAIGGHDSTAYFDLDTDARAQAGETLYSLSWQGATWYFVNEDNKKQFIANPEKYLPAYGGHCSNALSLGEGLIRTNGKHWLVLDNTLHLFYAYRGVKRWANGDYKQYKKIADKAWQNIIAQR